MDSESQSVTYLFASTYKINLVSVLLSTHVKRFSVSYMQAFCQRSSPATSGASKNAVVTILDFKVQKWCPKMMSKSEVKMWRLKVTSKIDIKKRDFLGICAIICTHPKTQSLPYAWLKKDGKVIQTLYYIFHKIPINCAVHEHRPSIRHSGRVWLNMRLHHEAYPGSSLNHCTIICSL